MEELSYEEVLAEGDFQKRHFFKHLFPHQMREIIRGLCWNLLPHPSTPSLGSRRVRDVVLHGGVVVRRGAGF